MKIGLIPAIVILTVIVLASCEENIEYDRDEVLLTINAVNWDPGNTELYVVIENSQSEAIYEKLTAGQEFVIKRGDEIKGDLINIHLIAIENIVSPGWQITSYYDIVPGKEINLAESLKSGSSTVASQFSIVDKIRFSDIPDFDIVSRNAMTQLHCHTLNSLEVPCTDSYFSGEYFYICLQKGDDAGYKMVIVPEVSEYVISLSDLNYDMTKYSIAKNNEYQQEVQVLAYGNDRPVEIFALFDEALFNGSNIDVFVPNDLPQMTSFGTSFSKTGDGHLQSSYYLGNAVSTTASYLDAGLAISHTAGRMPVINCSNDEFDLLLTSISFKDYAGSWDIYSRDGKGIYIPALPDNVAQAIASGFQLSQQFVEIEAAHSTAIEDSRLDGYEESVEYYLGIRSLSDEAHSIMRDMVLLESD